MTESLVPLSEQVVVIVGASRGIGRETALRFARRGATLVVAARDAEALDELAEAIGREGGRALAVPTDVSDWQQVERLAARAVDAFGKIDTWVNNAAVAVYGRFEQISIDEFRRVMDVNFFGQVYGCRAALPYLRRHGRGAIICVGSALSDRGVPLQAPYCAAEHAIKGFVESLRVELAAEDSGIQLTLVKPASVNTPLFDEARTKLGYQPRPLPPVYEPSLVADVIVHCAAHREREVTVGGGAKLLSLLEPFAGPVLDWYFERSTRASQRTSTPKGPDAPDNLEHPLATTRRVEGSFPGRSYSVYTWMRLHPKLVAGAGAAVAAAGVTRFLHDGDSEREGRHRRNGR